MRISLDWLREYAPLDAPIDELVAALVDTGTEVDRVHRGPEGVIVARVQAMAPVPESTKGVRFADLDVGTGEPLRVLTGAPNVEAGHLVPYAPPGTLLPGWDEPLAVRAMFGGKYQSPGMLCSAVELGTGDDAAGILLLERGNPGEPISMALDLDVLFDVDITTNRPDCLCHVGMARELAAALGETLTEPDTAIPASHASAVAVAPRLAVDVQTDGCMRFAARVIEGVVVAPSPPWMQRRLLAIGLRPINNIVDVSNYVMHELGQPLHAFDLDRFVTAAGGATATAASVVVRAARHGERVAGLDGVDRELGSGDLVVCSSDRPVSLAGIMGGAETAVDAATTTVLLESASWHGPQIRATSKRLALRTDASALYEKGLSDTLPPLALDRAAALMAELGHGHVLDGSVDVWRAPLPTIDPIEISPAETGAVLGCAVDADEMATALVRLGFSVEQTTDSLRITPPHFRRDVAIAADVVEEVGRELGYNRIPATLPGRRVAMLAPAFEPSAEGPVRELMLGAGFDEAITWSFTSAAVAKMLTGLGAGRLPMPLLNPLSEEWSVLRTSCLPGLCRALAGNLNHGLDDVALFEIGKAFWAGERQGLANGSTPDGADQDLPPLPAEPLLLAAAVHAADAGTAAAALRHLQSVMDRVAWDIAGQHLDASNANVSGLRPGRSGELRVGEQLVGQIGELDSDAMASLELRGRVVVAELNLGDLIPARARVPRYRQPGRFPAVVQDLAVVVPRILAAGVALAVITEAGGSVLGEVELYDEYRGGKLPEDRKSWTFRLAFRANDRTLTGEEARSAQEAIAAALKSRCGAEIRS